VTRSRRKTHSEDLHTFSPNINRITKSRRMGWSGYLARMVGRGGGEECVKNFGWRARRERPLGRPLCRWEDNIKMDCKEMWWECVDWIDLASGKIS
jgi:hypothetical protein